MTTKPKQKPKAKQAKPKGVWIVAFETTLAAPDGIWFPMGISYPTERQAEKGVKQRRESTHYRNVTGPVFIPLVIS